MSKPNDIAKERDHARLADFIRQNQAAIIDEWIQFAGTRSPASDGMSKLALKDHIVDILNFVAADLASAQTPHEQVDKSHGLSDGAGPFRHTAAEVHAALRLADGFDIDQMVSEYRALRASVVKQWVAGHKTLATTDIDDLTRFNESIDQAVTESVAHYTKTIDNSRNLFLGILGHDLRNPIGAASMAAQRMERWGTSDPKQAKVVSELVRTTERATRILNDLLDLTRSSFGTDIPITKAKSDIAKLCQTIADELRSINEAQVVKVELEGDPVGFWDAARMGQVLSNLMGNAIQYSDSCSPVTVAIAGNDPDAVTLNVHNFGPTIPVENQRAIFESGVRGQVNDPGGHTHLGLGLYIARLIIEAHGGKISVTSDEKKGTTFTVQLPRA
ncbi:MULTISPECIES: sensor histidine kinase [Bradyrhizobium]|uniref:sensor histidine kinase n=1 Tax=Bradyrhizobium TaxID=374 RepID=UPI00293E643E|nr:sensor histidine kinase [Bradyrhizobium sp. NDS-1]WOH70635.1 sensor histidine kinase [Bradyrhizobium sp. NDS-1]